MEAKYETIYRELNVTPTKQRVELAQLIFSKKHVVATSEPKHIEFAISLTLKCVSRS